MITFNVITIFPEAFESYLNSSLLGKAQKRRFIKINFVNPRDFVNVAPRRARGDSSPRRTVDDKPFGGGAGMVLKIEPIYKAVQKLKTKSSKLKTRVILFSTRGGKFDQKTAKRLSKYKNLILICGRYEGVDERAAKHVADEEISIGDYVLSGGELPAMILIEAVSRHIPGVLGRQESLEEIKGSYPVYTRPAEFKLKSGKKLKVPEVLLSGDHKKIEEWREKHSKGV